MVEKTVLGLKYHELNRLETMQYIFNNLGKKNALVRSDLNVGTVVSAQDDSIISEYIAESDLVNIDGMGILFYLKIKGISLERYTGVDLFQDILEKSSSEGNKVFLFGSKPAVLEEACRNIQNKHGQVISGYHHGYLNFNSENECRQIIEQINNANADFLFIGIKSPEKELFIKKYRDELEVSWIFGVGGAIDVVAGEVNRAPAWIQNIGFEWLYRVYQEPRRMWKRYLVSNSKFLLLIIKYLFK